MVLRARRQRKPKNQGSKHPSTDNSALIKPAKQKKQKKREQTQRESNSRQQKQASPPHTIPKKNQQISPSPSNKQVEILHETTPRLDKLSSTDTPAPAKIVSETLEARRQAHQVATQRKQAEEVSGSPTGIASTAKKSFTNKRIQKTKTQNIIKKAKQKQILIREIKKAEEAAKSVPGFFEQMLGGLGFYPNNKDHKSYIEELQGKIQKIDEWIDRSASELTSKLEAGNKKLTAKNERSRRKAINRTKFYRDLLKQYVEAESTGEIEVPINQRIDEPNIPKIDVEAQKIKQAERKAKPIGNILAAKDGNSNKRANGLAENMQKLFNNSPVTKKQPAPGATNSNTSITQKNIKSNQPVKKKLVNTNTKRKLIRNAMTGKNPYKLLGLERKKNNLSNIDYAILVKETFDKQLRAKKPKNITEEQHENKLAELRTARDFLLNNTLRTGFNSRVVQKINPETTPRSNTVQLLAEQRTEPIPKPFTREVEANVKASGSTFTNTLSQNAPGALLFG